MANDQHLQFDDNVVKTLKKNQTQSVCTLYRFDYKDNREAEEKESELKRVVNEQQKQISNLRAQVC